MILFCAHGPHNLNLTIKVMSHTRLLRAGPHLRSLTTVLSNFMPSYEEAVKGLDFLRDLRVACHTCLGCSLLECQIASLLKKVTIH